MTERQEKRSLSELLARVDEDMDPKMGYLPLVRHEVGEMTDRLRAIDAFHRPAPDGEVKYGANCERCYKGWPCETRRILDGGK